MGDNVWQINRSAKSLLIVSTNLDGLVCQIIDLPNLLNFSYTKLFCFVVGSYFSVSTDQLLPFVILFVNIVVVNQLMMGRSLRCMETHTYQWTY